MRKTSVACPSCSCEVPYCGRGTHPRCENCKREHENTMNRRWRSRNPEKVREFQRRGDAKRKRTGKQHYELYGRPHMIRTKWGMTVEQYDALIAQGCAICGEVASCIDHCHTTGQIRGPLCGKCNTGIGYFRDRVDLLRAAVIYLGELPV